VYEPEMGNVLQETFSWYDKIDNKLAKYYVKGDSIKKKVDVISTRVVMLAER
jgi:hypothetical protein